MKRCYKCREWKALTDFHRRAKAKDGRTNRCRECVRDYYLENRARLLSYQIAYNRDHQEERAAYAFHAESVARAKHYGCRIEYVPLDVRKHLERYYGRVCAVPGCGRVESLHIDHVIPLSKQGPHKVGNLQLLCPSHNSRKGVRSTDYRQERLLAIRPDGSYLDTAEIMRLVRNYVRQMQSGGKI